MLRMKPDAEILVSLGLALRAERTKRRWRQADLAAETGLAVRTVHRLEAGAPVGTDNLLRALRALGMLDRLDALIRPSLEAPLSPLAEDPEPAVEPRARVRLPGPR